MIDLKMDFNEAFNKNNLKLAWEKYIKKQIRRDTIKDVLYYEDFLYDFDKNIKRVIVNIRNNNYHPQPLLRMDILKPSFTLRPISIPEIEDRLVFQSILNILLPRIDDQLSDGCRNYRLKREDKEMNEEFEAEDVIEMEYWFRLWPEFMEDAKKYSEKYKFLVTSDVSAYFENIDHNLLRDYLRNFSNDSRTINLFMSMLEFWVWKNEEGFIVKRGIPQGFDSSAYIGNFFLDPRGSLTI